MKAIAFVASFTLIFFAKNIYGQQNGLVNNIQNDETNNPVSQQQPSNTMVNNIQRFLNRNGNSGAFTNKINQHQVQQQTNQLNQHQLLSGHGQMQVQPQINTPPPIQNDHQIQQPPNLNQQSLKVQQLLQQQPLQQQQSTPLLQPMQLQQPIQTNHPAQHQPLQSQNLLQSPQQPLSSQQNPPPLPAFQQNVDIPQQPVLNQKNTYQISSNSQFLLQPSNSQDTLHLAQVNSNVQNLNVQPQQNVVHPAEVIINSQQGGYKPQDVSSIRYYVSPQLSSSSVASNAPASAYNPSISIIPSYNVKPAEQTYVIPSYSYVNPSNDIQATIVETPKAISSVPAVLTVPSTTVQNSNMQSYYYNQPSVDPRQNIYYNQNTQIRYPQHHKVQLSTIQAQPAAAVIPSQPSILSSLPVSIVQSPSQYAIPSSYPVNTAVAPTYTSTKPKSTNFKSFLPLIFNLLREKIGSCGCKNGCPCDCQDNNGVEPEVLSGYSSLKRYGPLEGDSLSVLSTVSGESEGTGCLRERKNLKTEKVVCEDSEESQEDEESEDDDGEEEE